MLVKPRRIVQANASRRSPRYNAAKFSEETLKAPRLRLRRSSIPLSYPLVAPNYAKTRAALAKKFGLGRSGRMKARRPRTRQSIIDNVR